MKRKIAAVVAAVVLVGLGVAVAIGGSGEDPLVAKSYLESTYPSYVAQELQKRASEGTKSAYDKAVSKLDKAGEADVKAAENLQKSGGYETKTLNAGDILTLSRGSSIVVYSGAGTISSGVLSDVTTGRTVTQKERIEAGHRYIASDRNNVSVQVDAAGRFAVQGTVSILSNGQGGGETLPFTDIKKGDWYHGAVSFVYQKKYFSGTAEDMFAPNESMTRAMLATVLHRVSGLEPPGGGTAFTDVAAGQWYTEGISWASAHGIVNGMGDGNYHPDRAVTREELVTMLYRYQSYRGGNLKAKGSLTGYPDGETVASWAKEAMEWATGAGLVKGRDTGHLDPRGTATRAEVATILQRFDTLH